MKKNDFWTEEEGITLIAAWRRDGMPVNEIARKIGVKLRTLLRWERCSQELHGALAESREHADASVEAALLKKALGFRTTEEKYVIKADGKEEITTVIKDVPPDVSAASVWLKNRRPDRWRDKPGEGTADTFKKLDSILGGIDAEANR